jgi:small subunit ribosomal protein S27Ae
MAEKSEKKLSKAKYYDSSTGVLKRKAKFCPKCGPGIFMAMHKDRAACGKCGYMEKK